MELETTETLEELLEIKRLTYEEINRRLSEGQDNPEHIYNFRHYRLALLIAHKYEQQNQLEKANEYAVEAERIKNILGIP